MNISVHSCHFRRTGLPDGVVVKYVAEDGSGRMLDVRTGQTMSSDADAIRKASLRDYPEEVRYVGGTNDVWKASVISYDGGGFNETIVWHNEKTGREFRIGLQTPMVCWFIEDATMFSDGKIIFRLDCEQIVVVDPERKQIAVLAHGRHPVVEIKATRPNLRWRLDVRPDSGISDTAGPMGGGMVK